MIRIVVVDDHIVAQKGIVELVEQHEDAQVVGVGGAGNELFDLLAEHRPDMLITDLIMPAHANGPKGQRFEPVSGLMRVRQEFPDVTILVISMEDDIQTIQSLAEIGVQGYMLKTDAFTGVLDKAVEMLRLGAMYFSPEVKDAIIAAPRLTNESLLSKREMEALSALVRSPTSSRAEVAESMGIAESTLHKHINSMFAAFGVSSMEACFIRALRLRLVDAEGNILYRPSLV